MSECPECHKSYTRLDLHIRQKHPELMKPKAVVKDPATELVKKLVKPSVYVPYKSPVKVPPMITTAVRKLRPMVSAAMIEPIRLCDYAEHLGNNTPLTLQAAIDSPQYLRHVRSLKYSQKGAMMKRWPIFLVIGIVGVILVLIYFGVIPVGGR